MGGRGFASKHTSRRSPRRSPMRASARRFGRSILDNQTVHFKLAELQTDIELLRSLVYRAAELMIGGADVTQLATMAKLQAGQLGRELQAHAIMGRHGIYERDAREPPSAMAVTSPSAGGEGDADNPLQGHGDLAGHGAVARFRFRAGD